jgi:hypothetical protein
MRYIDRSSRVFGHSQEKTRQRWNNVELIVAARVALCQTAKNVTKTILIVQPPQRCHEGKRRFEAAPSVPLVRNSTLVSQQLAKTIDTYNKRLYIDHQRELAKGYQNDQEGELLPTRGSRWQGNRVRRILLRTVLRIERRVA